MSAELKNDDSNDAEASPVDGPAYNLVFVTSPTITHEQWKQFCKDAIIFQGQELGRNVYHLATSRDLDTYPLEEMRPTHVLPKDFNERNQFVGASTDDMRSLFDSLVSRRNEMRLRHPIEPGLIILDELALNENKAKMMWDSWEYFEFEEQVKTKDIDLDEYEIGRRSWQTLYMPWAKLYLALCSYKHNPHFGLKDHKEYLVEIEETENKTCAERVDLDHYAMTARANARLRARERNAV